MKGLKCIKLAIFFIICLLLSSLSLDANAVEYSDSSYINLSSGTLYCTNINLTLNSNSTGGVGVAASHITTPGQCSYLSLEIPSGASIPANSIVAVGITNQLQNPNQDPYYPVIGWSARSQAYSLVDNVFGEYGATTVYLYVDQPISGSLDLSPMTFLGNFYAITLRASPIYYVALEYTPTRSQIQSIINKLNTYDSTFENIDSNLQDIKDYLQDKEDQEQDDRDNIEQQSSDNQDSADDAGNEADQAGQTLMQAFGSLITALTSVHETNCTLPNMSVYSLNFNNINLCEVSPPQSIMALASIGMVLIIVPLGINLVKKMINLYKEITG